jgi:hypothetical protein
MIEQNLLEWSRVTKQVESMKVTMAWTNKELAASVAKVEALVTHTGCIDQMLKEAKLKAKANEVRSNSSYFIYLYLCYSTNALLRYLRSHVALKNCRICYVVGSCKALN